MLYYGLLISLFLDYVRPGAYVPIIAATKVGTIIPLLVFVVSLAYKGPITNGMVFSHTNTKWLLFLMFLLLSSILISDVTTYSFDVFNNVFGFLIWYYIITRIVNSIDKIKGVFIVLVFSHIIILLLNPQVVLDPSTRSYVHGNPFLGDGNDFSLSICIVVPMAIYLLQSSQKKHMRLIYVGVVLILGLAIIGTQSRGAALALGALFFYLWWYGRQKILGILMIATALFAIMLYAPPQYFERLDTIRNYEQESSAKTRVIAWKAAVRMATTHPLTGVGTGHFPVSIGRFQDEIPGDLTAHSMYFLILGELGFPGIIFLLSILLTNLFRNRRLMKQARGSPDDPTAQEFARLFFLISGSVIAFSVAGAFLSVTYYPHLYVLAALCSAIQLTYRNHQALTKAGEGESRDTPIHSRVQGRQP